MQKIFALGNREGTGSPPAAPFLYGPVLKQVIFLCFEMYIESSFVSSTYNERDLFDYVMLNYVKRRGVKI